MLGGEAAAGSGDDDAVDLDSGHAFGGVDRLANGAFGLVHVDDERRAFTPQRTLVADAEHRGCDACASRPARSFRPPASDAR